MDNLLIKSAIDSLANSYSPYSDFKVGAALLTKNGKIYTGCNIENASYSATLCAERTAFSNAISNGEREFETIAIVAIKDNKLVTAFPCGICRQFMAEFCDDNFKILVAKSETEYDKYLLSELLPNSFNKSDLR